MPDQTLAAFSDHGSVARTVDAAPADAASALERLADAGIDFDDVAVRLEDEGVRSFAKSFDDLLSILSDKASSLS
jgi:transaldolase